MFHARKDYNRRIQDSESIIPDDEPVFLLRGQDAKAPLTLELYVTLSEAGDFDPNITYAVKILAKKMRKWQEEHGCKTADMNKDDSEF